MENWFWGRLDYLGERLLNDINIYVEDIDDADDIWHSTVNVIGNLWITYIIWGNTEYEKYYNITYENGCAFLYEYFNDVITIHEHVVTDDMDLEERFKETEGMSALKSIKKMYPLLCFFTEWEHDDDGNTYCASYDKSDVTVFWGLSEKVYAVSDSVEKVVYCYVNYDGVRDWYHVPERYFSIMLDRYENHLISEASKRASRYVTY